MLHDAVHAAFGDSRRLKADLNPNHHKAIKSPTTAFWDANVKQDKAAQAWLNSPQAKTVLEPKDVWQQK